MRTGAVWAVCILAAGAGGWWAASATLQPPSAPPPAATVPTVEVVQGTLGRSIAVPVVARWTLTPLATSAAQGTVTSIDIRTGARIAPGTTLFTVDLRPVVAAEGTVPAFRDLGRGDRGADVTQVQRFLTTLGHYRGPADGSFGPSTVTAVKTWQTALGVKVTGEIGAGDLIFVPDLPRRVTLDDLRVGTRLTGGRSVLQAVAREPVFLAQMEPEQFTALGPEPRIEVTGPEEQWDAVVASTEQVEGDTTIEARLTAPDGGPVCGADCAEAIPVRERGTVLGGSAVVVPEASGPMVPRTALVTDSQGRSAVLDPDGTRLPVTVVVAADGQAVVQGVEVGTRVRIVAPEKGAS